MGYGIFPISFHCFLRIRPRVLVDVSRIDLSTYVLGYNISAPILIAPTSLHKLAHPEGLKSSKKDFGWDSFPPAKCLYYLLFVSGEVVTARAAAACKTIMVLIQQICHTYKRCCRLIQLSFTAGSILHIFLHFGGGCFQLQCCSVLSNICIVFFLISYYSNFCCYLFLMCYYYYYYLFGRNTHWNLITIYE